MRPEVPQVGGTAPKGCLAILERMTAAAAGYFEYNLYDECTYDDLLSNGAVNDYSVAAAPRSISGFCGKM